MDSCRSSLETQKEIFGNAYADIDYPGQRVLPTLLPRASCSEVDEHRVAIPPAIFTEPQPHRTFLEIHEAERPCLEAVRFV